MAESTRKLAAIVFTDIVGFTKLTADNQQKASDLLDIQRNEIKPIVESHGGQWIKEMADTGMSATLMEKPVILQLLIKFRIQNPPLNMF